MSELKLQQQQSVFNVNRRMRIMEDISAGGHRRIDSTRPTLGFPLGTALILLIVFGISALFSCCYHWEKIKSMHTRHHGRAATNSSSQPTPRLNFTPDAIALPLSTAANLSNPSKNSNSRIQQSRNSLPVMMPGDDVPKFMALPSPHGVTQQTTADMASSHTNQSKRSRP